MGTRFWNRETESRGLERQPSVWKIGNAAISATDWFISSFVALLRKTVEAIQYLGPARWGYAFQWIWSSVVSTDFHSIRQTVVNQRNSSPSFNTFLASPLPVSFFWTLHTGPGAYLFRFETIGRSTKTRPGSSSQFLEQEEDGREHVFRKLQDVSSLTSSI